MAKRTCRQVIGARLFLKFDVASPSSAKPSFTVAASPGVTNHFSYRSNYLGTRLSTAHITYVLDSLLETAFRTIRQAPRQAHYIILVPRIVDGKQSFLLTSQLNHVVELLNYRVLTVLGECLIAIITAAHHGGEDTFWNSAI